MGATCCHILKRRKHSRCSSCCQARWGESTWFIHCHWNERFLKKRFLKSCKPAGPAQHICDGPMSYMLKEKKQAQHCPVPFLASGAGAPNTQVRLAAWKSEVCATPTLAYCLYLFVKTPTKSTSWFLDHKAKTIIFFQKWSMKLLWLFTDTVIRH